ncbi:MAG: hypothetical protein ACM34I_08300 [bacterium]
MSDLHERETCSNDRLKKLEATASEIRKLVFGALLLAKEIGKERIEKNFRNSELLKIIQEAEESFPDTSISDNVDRLENVLRIIRKRSQALFLLLDSLSRTQQRADESKNAHCANR